MIKLIHPGSEYFVQCIAKEPNIQDFLSRLKEHSKETYEHSYRVASLCADIGRDLDFSAYDRICAGYSGLLHDIGKLQILRDILEKSSLTKEELSSIRKHSRFGFLMIRKLGYHDVMNVIVAHHEYKIDPYPRNGDDRRNDFRNAEERRDKSDRIVKLAQVLAAADIYDGLSYQRSYKPPFPRQMIEEFLKQEYVGDKKYADLVLERHYSDE
ncbi:MAG: HD domain-containing protein [Candidatus Aenigmarchaeota archaeon]|nr:HD domain-containing protein [Candidatus Aenigmarchaeota archaeon]